MEITILHVEDDPALAKLVKLALTTGDAKSIHVLARQPVDLSRPHPFTAAGNREFNSCLWMPPQGSRGGDILLTDSTIFTTLFGGTESLELFWRNMATLRVKT